MEILSKEDFQELAAFREKNSLSVFIPTHRSGMEVNEMQDAILFKNKLQEISGLLEKKGVEENVVEKILRSGYDLLKWDEFWRGLSDGLAVFMAEDFFKAVKIPRTVKEEIMINDSFYLAPLLPVIQNEEEFFLLVFSKHDAKFYQGNPFGMKELEVKGLPNGMNDVVHFEEKGGKQLFRRGGRDAEASFHGQGPGVPDEKEFISQYLKEVDQTLMTEVLGTQTAPLLLAAVDYMVAIYRQISHYQHVAPEAITGNYEREDINSLFKKAREILAPYFKDRIKKALDNYYNHSATALTASIPADVIPASFYGQVADLFVRQDAHIWGAFEPDSNHLELHEEKQNGDDCLVNAAMVKTLLNNGHVYVLPGQEMPGQSTMAAFLRY